MTMKINKTIKELRKEAQLSQTELAKHLNTTQDTISLWELGKSTPDAENIVKWQNYLKFQQIIY